MFFAHRIRLTKLAGRYGEEPNDDSPPNDPPPSDPPDEPVTYTKEEFEAALKTEREKNRKSSEPVLQKLKELEKNKNLTEKERNDLKGQIANLQNSLKTKEELAREALEEKEREKQEQVSLLTGERDSWKNNFFAAMRDREITQASSKHEAHNPVQIQSVLGSMIEMVETLDDAGEATGTYTPVVKFPDNGKVLSLSIDQAVEKMKTMPEHGNLFKSGRKHGFQSGGTPNNRPVTAQELAEMPMEEYLKHRDEIFNRGVQNNED